MDVKLRMYLCTYTRNYIRTVAKSTWGHKLLSQNKAFKMSDIPTGLNLNNEEKKKRSENVTETFGNICLILCSVLGKYALSVKNITVDCLLYSTSIRVYHFKGSVR